MSDILNKIIQLEDQVKAIRAMQMTYRVTKWNTPDKDETLVGSKEQAESIIADLNKKLSGKLRPQERATYLCAKATLYEALGDTRMMDAAKEAYKFCKNSNSAALVAVALHHFGQLKEANEWYEKAWKYPHEEGFEIDIGYSNSLLCRGEYLKAWPIVRKLKKRMVYAGYMKEWDGKPCTELQVISEGGFGDIIQNARFLPLLASLGVRKPIVYLPPFFYEHGFVDLARQQPWFPEIRVLTEARQNVPSAGFFDLPAIFQINTSHIPPAPKWEIGPYEGILEAKQSLYGYKIGFCWRAAMSETPLCPTGVYRSLTDDQALSILNAGMGKNVTWISLQKDISLDNSSLCYPSISNWEDTAHIINGLDAVITVDTAVMHLAASMGKLVYVILSGASDWKFGITDKTCLWYPNVHIIRNNEYGFEKAVEQICAVISGSKLNEQITVKN